jgi:hypothetical protein
VAQPRSLRPLRVREEDEIIHIRALMPTNQSSVEIPESLDVGAWPQRKASRQI